MPNYKTHSIHSELLFDNTPSFVGIDKEELKKFSFGPDTLMLTEYNLFEDQHRSKTRAFFETLLKSIKENKLQDDSQVMAFVYGHIAHFSLDAITHPLIYYMTEKLPKMHKISPHALIEMWLDDYIMQKYNKDEKHYYKNRLIIREKLKGLIDELYTKLYQKNYIAKKYELGIISFQKFEDIIRASNVELFKVISKQLNLGDFFYEKSSERVKPFLNLNHRKLFHPVTGQPFTESFDDLWNRAVEVGSDTIEDVNNYLYRGKRLKNYLIKNNISYNTGLPCKKRIRMRFFRKYDKEKNQE